MKKALRYFISFILLFILITATVIPVCAVPEDFPMRSVDEESKEKFLNNTKITLLTKDPKIKFISRFDVNENGLIAIGSDNLFYSRKIAVYSSDGAFRYGISFKTAGEYGIEWEGDMLVLYFYRSELLFWIDSEGNVLNIVNAAAADDDDEYLHGLKRRNYMRKLQQTKRQIGDVEYRLESRPRLYGYILPIYSVLLVTDANGTRRKVYDAGPWQYLQVLGFISIIVLLFVQTKNKDKIKQSP